MLKTLFSLLKKPILYVPFVLVLFGAGWFFLKPDSTAARYETAVAEIRNVAQTVSVTGRVEPSRSTALSFERSGTVSSVRVLVGDAVLAGATLMTLGNSDILARVEQAAAARAVLEAALAELGAGARPEERAIKDVRYKDAAVALSEAKRSLFDAVRNAYVKADDAVRNKADQFFDNPRSAHPALAFLSPYKEELEFKRFLLEDRLTRWKADLGALSEDADLALSAGAARTHLETIKEFFDVAASAVNSLTPGTLSQAAIDGYKTNVAYARSSISAELSALASATSNLRSRESALLVAESERALAFSGATKEAIAVAEARVDEARAREKEARAELRKTVLSAPFAGTVSKITPRAGEFIGASLPAVSLISAEQFKIEAFVPEADVVKVSIGNEARVALDAYGGEREFFARVVGIEPEATLFDGVPAYKTTLYFSNGATGIRAGMTADIEIATGVREKVLAIPQRAVETRGGSSFVRVLEADGVPKEKKITAGLRGTDGFIEILSGLSAGASVITFEQ